MSIAVYEHQQQINLFPTLLREDKKRTRLLLTLYPKMKTILQTLSERELLTSAEKEYRSRMVRYTQEIDKAFDLILDDEVRRILEHRYIKGRKYSTTIDLFYSDRLSERTIDRRIDKGVTHVAEILKLAGLLHASLEKSFQQLL